MVRRFTCMPGADRRPPATRLRSSQDTACSDWRVSVAGASESPHTKRGRCPTDKARVTRTIGAMVDDTPQIPHAIEHAWRDRGATGPTQRRQRAGEHASSLGHPHWNARALMRNRARAACAVGSGLSRIEPAWVSARHQATLHQYMAFPCGGHGATNFECSAGLSSGIAHLGRCVVGAILQARTGQPGVVRSLVSCGGMGRRIGWRALPNTAHRSRFTRSSCVASWA
jgi:hypothetical protein